MVVILLVQRFLILRGGARVLQRDDANAACPMPPQRRPGKSQTRTVKLEIVGWDSEWRWAIVDAWGRVRRVVRAGWMQRGTASRDVACRGRAGRPSRGKVRRATSASHRLERPRKPNRRNDVSSVISATNFSAWTRMYSTRTGTSAPPRKPGSFSTSAVVVSEPPRRWSCRTTTASAAHGRQSGRRRCNWRAGSDGDNLADQAHMVRFGFVGAISSIRFSTSSLISSRIGRTASMSRPEGSSNGQSM